MSCGAHPQASGELPPRDDKCVGFSTPFRDENFQVKVLARQQVYPRIDDGQLTSASFSLLETPGIDITFFARASIARLDWVLN